MSEFLFYAFAVLLFPLGTLWAVYVVTRANDRELERDKQLQSRHR